MPTHVDPTRVQAVLAQGLTSLPGRLRGRFETEFAVGLGQRLGADVTKTWYGMLSRGLAEGFVKGIGTALAFVVMFGVLMYIFKEPASMLRYAMGARGMLVSIPMEQASAGSPVTSQRTEK